MIERELVRRLFDASVRVEKMMFIGTEEVDEPSEMVEDWFFDDFAHEEPDFIAGKDNWLMDIPDAAQDPREALEIFLDREIIKGGFMAEFKRPVPRNMTFSDDGSPKSWSLSWGHYWTKVIYGETLEALFDAAVQWGEKVFQEEVQEIKKQAGEQG